mmetsp:Transcript_123729/g.385296  ORF Transcript_123729/g.385296 Transcript_123729/m.385296 type:complete len:166 (+) Transcript_123729:86-583(+)
MARSASVLVAVCLSLPLATGLRLGAKDTPGPGSSLKDYVEYYDPFAVVSSSTLVRLGSKQAASKFWGQDRAKTFTFAGVSNGKFKGGGALMGGVSKAQAHAEAAVGYSGTDAKGVAPASWSVAGGKAGAPGWEVMGAVPSADGGVDYTKVSGELSSGRALAKDLR